MKKVRLLKILITGAAILNNTFALEIHSTKLKDLVEQKNARVEASQFQIQSAQQREGVLMRSFVPSLKLSASQEYFKTALNKSLTQPTYGAEATLNLYNGGKDSLESEIRKTNSELQVIQAGQVLILELQKVRSTYWEILYFQNKLKLIQDAIDLNKTNTEMALKRIRNGVATNTDKLEFDMEAVNLKQEKNQTEIKLKNGISTLNVLLNISPNEKIEFKEAFIHDHNLEPILADHSQHSEFLYKDLVLNSKIHEIEANKEKRNLWPQIDAFASYYQFNQREKDFMSSKDRDEYALGLKITIDLQSGIESSAEASALNYQARGAKLLAHLQKQEVDNHIKNEQQELNFLHDQVHDAEENIIRAQAYYKLTQSEYSRGVKNSPDVLASSRRLFEMKHKILELIKDYQISKGHLFALIGK